MKLSKRFRILAAILGGGIVVASSACNVDSLEQATAPQSRLTPASASTSSSAQAGSGQSVAAQAAIPDMSKDGTYNVTVDPLVSNTLTIGTSKLEVPASAICSLGTSGYGSAFWDSPCVSETRPVQLVVTVKNTSLGASIDFNPALRFNPLTNVQLTLSAPQVQRQDAKNWLILYCSNSTSTPSTTSGKGSGGAGGGKDGSKCVNESLTDKDLKTFIDYDLHQLSRRIKHFSLYRVDSGWLGGE
jgi:hypothetical protein